MNVLLRCCFAFFNADIFFAAKTVGLLFVNADFLVAIVFAAETVTCDRGVMGFAVFPSDAQSLIW
jgi:hypothetical protein